MRYLRFEDADELVGHLHLMDVRAIAVAVKSEDGQECILFNDSDAMADLLNTIKEAADELPVDIEVISSEEITPTAIGEEHVTE